ncbi:uncharacterized protein LAJ45_09229 [Morchella importuna]|uniref:uncharacterized protein n=1 Tax=Morchella importuna TaxID=1174673 RepID=UPI001E8D71BB|nr:uncharacterized protein LAJ45_09229 [Morchella importuna]KAH8146855.1 hypothetical protein LAJ45_09229 [Morchella importuna]
MSENSHSSQAAPIDEYRVLWTAQKKQKLKKWHDGFLRFHKFNKRLLVYDDARHLVADMYLRGRDTIEEGDDLEFENHLVTVEDFKGTVVQDLTPLFTSVVKRKQQIQAVNTLISSETPNQANRHGPWGPNSRNATPTPHQRPMAAAARFPPQTPMQQRPTNMGMSLQHSIRANNNTQHPHSYKGRSLGQAQSLPTRIEPAQRPNRISNPNPPIQQLRQSGPQVSDAATSSTSYRPPLNALGGPPSPNRRLNQPSKQQAPLEPPQNHLSSIRRKKAPSCPAPPHVNRGSLNLNGFSDAARPLEPPLKHSRTNNIFSNPAPVNKSTPNLVIDTDSDDELFGSPPDFNINSASPPPAQETDLRPASASKRSLNGSKNQYNDPRAFKPPSKGKTISSPEKTPSRGRVAMSNTDAGEGSNPRISQPLPNDRSSAAPLRNPQVAVVDSNPITSSGDESEKEKEPFEPLVTTGKILLGNTAKRKRTKLLCQRPSPVAPKDRPTDTKERESVAKKPRKEPASKASSPPTVIGKVPDEDLAMVDFANDAPIPPPPAVKKNLSAFKFRPPTRVHQNKSDDKGKGIANDAQYRIEEKEDTVEYQKEHDIGPWSSEALFLFDWRPPGMREKGK